MKPTMTKMMARVLDESTHGTIVLDKQAGRMKATVKLFNLGLVEVLILVNQYGVKSNFVRHVGRTWVPGGFTVVDKW